jgi:hypothetical protein
MIKLTDYNSKFAENFEYINFIFTEKNTLRYQILNLLTAHKTVLNKLRTKLKLLEIHWTVKIHRIYDIGLIATITNLTVSFIGLCAQLCSLNISVFLCLSIFNFDQHRYNFVPPVRWKTTAETTTVIF